MADRKSGRKAPGADKIAEILVDAELTNDARCCARHKISRRTLVNYRQRREKQGEGGEIARLCAEKKRILAPQIAAAIAKSPLPVEVVNTRLALLERMRALAATSDDLKAVAGAYKLVTDAELAEKVVKPDGQRDQPPGMEGEGGPAPEAPGARVH